MDLNLNLKDKDFQTVKKNFKNLDLGCLGEIHLQPKEEKKLRGEKNTAGIYLNLQCPLTKCKTQ